jgi:NAD(P)H dehydrogenase (quinone)
MVIVGLPYAFQGQTTLDENHRRLALRATTIAGGQGQRQPSQNELAGARYQGSHVARIAGRLKGRHET